MALQRRLPGLCERDLTPAVERVLDRCSPSSGRVRIERLDIDAGTLDLASLESDLPKAVADALERALQVRIPQGRTVSSVLSDDMVFVSEQQAIIEAFLFFLKTGRLPWSFRLPEGRNLEQVVLGSWKEEMRSTVLPSEIQERIAAALASPDARKRLARQFSAPFFEKLLLMLPSGAGAVRIMDEIGQILRSAAAATPAVKGFERLICEVLVERLVEGGSCATGNIIAQSWRMLHSENVRLAPELRVLLERRWPGVTSGPGEVRGKKETTEPTAGDAAVPVSGLVVPHGTEGADQRERTDRNAAAKPPRPAEQDDTWKATPLSGNRGASRKDADSPKGHPASSMSDAGKDEGAEKAARPAKERMAERTGPDELIGKKDTGIKEMAAPRTGDAAAPESRLAYQYGTESVNHDDLTRGNAVAGPPSPAGRDDAGGQPALSGNRGASRNDGGFAKNHDAESMPGTSKARAAEKDALSGVQQVTRKTPSSSQRPAGGPLRPAWATVLSPDGEICGKEGMYIGNAGTVLLHPFLPRFFSVLGIAEEETLLRPERALCLLHYLTAGQTRAPEHELTLHKILCGLPLNLPAESDVNLTTEEQSEADALLRAVIGHWTVLQNTSLDGLRGTFLLRPGKVSLRNDEWLLQVERRSCDILLDQLPWGISMIKLPWMKKMLRVEWK